MLTNKLNLNLLKLIKVNHFTLTNLYNGQCWHHYYIGNCKSLSLINNAKIVKQNVIKPKYLMLIRHLSNNEDIHGASFIY